MSPDSETPGLIHSAIAVVIALVSVGVSAFTGRGWRCPALIGALLPIHPCWRLVNGWHDTHFLKQACVVLDVAEGLIVLGQLVSALMLPPSPEEAADYEDPPDGSAPP